MELAHSTMTHLLWIDRNHYIFSGKSAIPDQFLPKVFGQVAAFHRHLLKPGIFFIETSHELDVRWFPPP